MSSLVCLCRCLLACLAALSEPSFPACQLVSELRVVREGLSLLFPAAFLVLLLRVREGIARSSFFGLCDVPHTWLVMFVSESAFGVTVLFRSEGGRQRKILGGCFVRFCHPRFFLVSCVFLVLASLLPFLS